MTYNNFVNIAYKMNLWIAIGLTVASHMACKIANKSQASEESYEETVGRTFESGNVKLIISQERMSYLAAVRYCTDLSLLTKEDVERYKPRVPSEHAVDQGFEFAWLKHTGAGLRKQYWYYAWQNLGVTGATNSQGPAYAVCKDGEFSRAASPSQTTTTRPATRPSGRYCRHSKITIEGNYDFPLPAGGTRTIYTSHRCLAEHSSESDIEWWANNCRESYPKYETNPRWRKVTTCQVLSRPYDCSFASEDDCEVFTFRREG